MKLLCGVLVYETWLMMLRRHKSLVCLPCVLCYNVNPLNSHSLLELGQVSIKSEQITVCNLFSGISKLLLRAAGTVTSANPKKAGKKIWSFRSLQHEHRVSSYHKCPQNVHVFWFSPAPSCTRSSAETLIVISVTFLSQRFIQYLASRNTLFNLNNFLDKGALQGMYMIPAALNFLQYCVLFIPILCLLNLFVSLHQATTCPPLSGATVAIWMKRLCPTGSSLSTSPKWKEGKLSRCNVYEFLGSWDRDGCLKPYLDWISFTWGGISVYLWAFSSIPNLFIQGISFFFTFFMEITFTSSINYHQKNKQ